MKSVSNTTKVVLLLIILLLAAIALAVFFYSRYQYEKKMLANPQVSTEAQTRNLTQKVGKLMVLPQGDDPTMATVLNRDVLKTQPFFAHAQNGDVLLMYPKTKLAILYRPSENKIINVASINIGATASSTPSPDQPSPAPLRVTIYNGTTTPGVTYTTAWQLEKAMPDIVIVSRDNANKTYQKSLVVDLTGANNSQANQIASLLKADVGPLPVGEASPNTASQPVDILVIVGTAK